MLFPGDTQPTPVPTNRVAEARAANAVFQTKPWAMAALDATPDIASAVGQVGGAAVGSPALALGPLGALVPASMGVAGGGIGGAVGQGIRQLGYQAMGYGQAPGSIGEESKRGATGAALGELTGAIGGAIARPLVAHGMGNPKVPEGQPNPVTTNIDEVRAPTGKILGKPGSAKAVASRQASSQNLVQHMNNLTAAGQTVDGTAAIDRAYQKLSGELQHDATGASQQQLDNLYNDTIARHGRDLTPREALARRQRWDRSSAPVLKAIERANSGGPLPDPTTQLSAQWDKALADEMRAEIENTSGAASGVTPEQSPARAINRVTQRRIAVSRAIKATESRPRSINPIVTGLGGGAAALAGGHGGIGAGAEGLAGALAAHLATQPEVTSRAGLALTDPYVQMLLRTTPRFLIPQQNGQ